MVAKITDPKVRLGMDPSQYEAGAQRATLSTQRLLKAQEAADRKWRAMQAAHGAAIREDEARQAELARATEDAERRRQDAYKRTGQVAVTAGAAVLAGLAYGAKQAMSWESAFAGVTKTVDGTAEQLAQVEDGLRGLATSLPSTHEEIAAVAEAAGQLGVQRDAIVGFTKTMIDLGETTNLSADEAATGIAQLVNVIDSRMLQSPDAISRLGSTIVALGNDGASTEADILAMAQRIAGAGKLAGASTQDVLALSSTLSSLGLSAEAGGSATARALTKMYAAVKSGGKELASFAQTAGMTSDAWAALFDSSPVEALDAFVQGLATLDAQGGNVVETLREVGFKSTEDQRALLSLKGANDLLVDGLALANRAWSDNSALVAEAAKRYDTTEAKVQIAQNAIRDAGISLGETFLPMIASAAEQVAGFAKAISDLPEPVLHVAGVLGAVAGAVTVLGGAVILALPKWRAFQQAMTDMRAAGSVVPSRLGKLTGAVGKLAGAVAAVGTIGAIIDTSSADASQRTVAQYTKELLRLKEAAAPDSDSIISDLARAYRDLTGDASLFDKIGNQGSHIAKLWGGKTDYERLREAFGGIGQALASMYDSSPDLAAAKFNEMLEITGGTTDDLLGLLPEYRDRLQNVENAQAGAAASTESYTEHLNAATGATEELTDAQLEYLDAIASSDAALISLSGAYSDTVEDARVAAQAQADAFNEGQAAAEKAAREQGKTLELARRSWEDYYDGRTVSLDKYLEKLQGQVDAQNQWESDLLTLTGRGVSRETIDRLREDGIDAAPLVRQLAEGSDEQLAKLDELYAQAGESATKQFADQLMTGAPVLAAAGEQLGREAVDAIIKRMLAGKETLQAIVNDYRLIVEGMPLPYEGAFTSPSAPDASRPSTGTSTTQYARPIGPGLDANGVSTLSSSYPSSGSPFPSAGAATAALPSSPGSQIVPVAVPLQITQAPDQSVIFSGPVSFTDPAAAASWGRTATAAANTAGGRVRTGTRERRAI